MKGDKTDRMEAEGQGKGEELMGGRDERRIEIGARGGEETKEERRWKRTEVSKRSFKREINHFDSLSVSLLCTRRHKVSQYKSCV